MTELKTSVYTGGSVLKGTNKCGWAFFAPQRRICAAGGELGNFKYVDELPTWAELRAIIEALRRIDGPVRIYTDSQDAIRIALGTDTHHPFWNELDDIVLYSAGREVEYLWTKSHAGDPYNELVDRMAREARVHIQRKGAPPLKTDESEVYSFLPIDAYRALWNAARNNNRSLGEEIRYRLMRSMPETLDDDLKVKDR